MKRLFTKIRRNVSIALVTLLLRIILRKKEYTLDVLTRVTDGKNDYYVHRLCDLTKHQIICLCLQPYDSSISSDMVNVVNIRDFVSKYYPNMK